MTRIILLVMLIFSTIFCGANNETASAKEISKSRSFEAAYTELGYKTVEEAVKEFESHFNQDLKLPLRIPPLTFTHEFGRFNDVDGPHNDSFELLLVNERKANDYFIYVRPIDHKIPIENKRIIKLFKLRNGNEAKYVKISDSFVALVFERDNWQYMLTIPNRISKKITPAMLVEIADSIDYPSEKKNPFD